IMTEMVDGWIEVPVVYEPIVRTRFGKKPSPAERDRESEGRVTAVEYIWYPTRTLPFPFNQLPQDSRSCPTPLKYPLESPLS
ncbi:hypothetical protein K443DRAFT_115624, partial [Laccaria amethystina LaAM-08-1]